MTFATITQKTVIETFGGRDATPSAIGGALAQADKSAEKNTQTVVRALAKFVPEDKKERNAWKADMREAYQSRRGCGEATARQAIDRYSLAALVWRVHKEDVSLNECQSLYKSDATRKPTPVADGAKPQRSGGNVEPTEPRREEASGAASLAIAQGRGADVGSPALRTALAAFASHTFKLGKMESADADMITDLLAAIRGDD